ncbi:cell division protein ZapA [Porphyromonas sp.]
MSEDGRDHSLQRITIAIEGQRLSLRVPRALEQRYRLAGEELVRTSQSYHAKYPNVSEVGRQTYLAMSALDVAMRYRELVEQREAHSRHFEPRLSQLNETLEALLTQATATLQP